jgi:ubiquitin-conjugating enzyme E2 D/E
LSNQRDFNLLIRGPADSPYADGLFEVNIKLTTDYPLKPPKITFLSEIYHPNIRNSSICLSTLKDGSWSPALMLYKVLMSLQALLADPNPDDPLDPDSANEFKSNKVRFVERATSATKRATDKVMERRNALAQKNA